MSEGEPSKTVLLLGGARVGWLRVTWPLAVLRAREDGLELISALGRRRFAPEEVVAIEPVTWFPLLSWGVSIEHLRSDAPEQITFWSIRPPAGVVRAIARAGFVAKGTAAKVDRSQDETLVVRPQLLGVAVLIAGLILAVDRLLIPIALPGQPSYATIAALALVLGASLLVRRRGRFRRFAMTTPDAPPRHRELLNLVTIISALMLFGAVMELLDYLKID